jgi:hypothetical protein
VSFCNNPIPAGFFDPGSEPFDGVIRLRGETGGSDTVVRRMAPMVLDLPGQTAQVPIELVQLNLVSCAPITVTVGSQVTQWNVSVDLSPNPAPPGQMIVRKTHPNGGTFESSFAVRPVFTFTRVTSPFDVRVLDPNVVEPLRSIEGPSPWVHSVPPGTLPTICGVNFIPGVAGSTVDVPSAACIPPGGLCCKDVGHAGPNGSTHVTGQVCTPCECGACCDPANGTCQIVTGATPGTSCSALGGDYKGDGTSCADADVDGVPDVNENHACCEPPNACNSGSDPSNPDTDADGLLDGVDPDPCVAAAGVPAVPRPWALYAMLFLIGVGLLAGLYRRRRSSVG